MSTYALASHRVAASSSRLPDGWHTSGHVVGEGKSATAASATIAVRRRDTTNGASTLRAADTAAMLGARKVDPVPLREFDRVRIPRVGVTHDAGTRIGRENAAKLLATQRRAVGDRDHPRMDRVADSHAAAMVYGYPCRARRGIQERIEDGPVGYRVAAVAHRLGLAER